MTELFKITQLALKDEPILFKLDDEKSIFIALKENGLFGLVGPYLDEAYCSNRFYSLTKSVLFDYISRDIKQQALIESVQKLFNDHQIKHIFLKGSRLKPLYKETYMRGMGDIDILIEAHNLEVVKVLFEQASYTLESRSQAHDFYRISDDLIIEIHPRLYNDFNPKYKPLFDRLWTDSTRLDGYRYQLEPSFEVLYLMNHLAKHLESSGIGLRSILDIGIFLKHYDDKIDLKLLNHYLSITNMRKYFNSILYLNKVYFGLDSIHLDKNYVLSNDALEHITKYIMTSGIHGKGTSFNPMAPRLAKSNSRFKVLLNTLFLPYKHLKVIYPRLEKYPVLYPFYIIIRLFDLMFNKKKHSLKKIKQLNEGKKNTKDIKQIFNDLGL